MARDPKPGLIAEAERKRATVAKCELALSNARKAYRRALLDARTGGVTGTELARVFGTGESRIRQEVTRAIAEAK
jgi:DNA-directed RNA polymerase specialized sigma24 family protein